MKSCRLKSLLITLLALFVTTNALSAWKGSSQGWIYPGNPACDAPITYQANKIQVLKPQYYNLQNDGSVLLLTVANAGCNAYSAANVADLKAHSNEQYVTVSGVTATMHALVSSTAKRTAAINTWVQFLTANTLTGLELDWEGYSGWSATDYAQFLSFCIDLGSALHAAGKKLMIVGPAQTGQGSWLWNYADFNSRPVDYVLPMVYDYQWDFGAGTPISPNQWMTQVVAFMKTKVSDPKKIVIGMPSYGYHGATGGYNITIDTYLQSQKLPGFSTAKRNAASYEMMWAQSGTSYDYQDQSGLDSKRTLIESLGMTAVSVWHLGSGNLWFSGEPGPTPTVSPSPSPTPTITPTPTPTPTPSPTSGTPKCMKSGTDVVVGGLPSNAGCVMRTDTYQEQVPVQGVAVFSNAVKVKSVEVYQKRLGPKNCTGFIYELSCQ